MNRWSQVITRVEFNFRAF